MGKRLIQQRRGKGTPRYRSPSHRFKGDITYPAYRKYSGIGGQVIELVHDPGRTAPLAKILLEDFEEILMIAPEGLHVGQWIGIGDNATMKPGNVLPMRDISEGTEIYNLEIVPGDGGKLVRAAGASARIVSHEKESNLTYVQLPSKRSIAINSSSRASIGKVAGGGKKEKPFAHAGQAYYAHRARSKLYPKVRGVAMNPVDHPHGGGGHSHVGRPTTRSRDTPPGRKVGHIAAKSTGKKKR